MARSLILFALLAGCTGSIGSQDVSDSQLAAQLAQDLTAACPSAAPDDLAAREACATQLTQLDSLRERLAEPLLWGGQKAAGDYALADSNLTRFNPLVWRKMYLSLFTFDGTFVIEQTTDATVLHLPAHFRNGLDAGAYPYPFWHSAKKWSSYEHSTEMLLVISHGKVVGAMRSSQEDAARADVPHTWDGIWDWSDGKGEEPRVSLYGYLFGASNPKVDALDDAYRDLEFAMRQQNCHSCHAPDNAAKMNPLELFSYPNQALQSRHHIVQKLEANQMPPGGIADEAQRAELLRLARVFEAAADDALSYQGEEVAP